VYREAMAMMERPLLLHALSLTGGNQLRAARLLGVNRNTLRKRCRDLGLEPSRRPGRATVPPA
jgi:two-component system nitrogen regulation response regulator GlnG